MTLRSKQFIPPLVFALLSLLAYGNCLFDESQLPAAPGTDLEMQFISWREFGFGEMLRGNIPLWNPHIFGGTPYMASFQSALFYPLNWLHFFLPVGLAISWYCAVHTFLMGYFTSLWATYRGISVQGQILAGVMAMFSGQYFLHAYAGHLPHLAVMVWAPLIFLCVDALADGKSWKWLFVGSIAVAMQILAGHPQYVFYGALAVGLYVLLRIFFSPHRVRLIGGVACMYVAGAVLCAIQLLPGLDATRENVRIGGLPYDMAAQFSTAPEQWITAISPFVFGHLHEVVGQTGATNAFYIGYGYLWELCFFVSFTGFVLAIVGVLATSRARRITCLVVLGVLVIISMGRFTPVHRLLYDYLPGFGSFRVPAKFMFYGTLIIAMLAAEGLDALRSENARLHLRRAAIIAAQVFIVLGLIWAALLLDSDLWSWQIRRLANAPERFNAHLFEVPDFIAAGLRIARGAIGASVASAGILLAIILVARRQKAVVCALVVFAVLELTIFALITRGTMPNRLPFPAEWADAMRDNPQQRRCINMSMRLENLSMSLGTYDVWGYDPGVLRRYGQLLTASQAQDPDRATQYIRFQNLPNTLNMLRMLRLGWVFAMNPEPAMLALDNALPQAQLISAYDVIGDRDSMFARLLDKSFDPARMVFLESPPGFASASAALDGKVTYTPLDTDRSRIEVDTPRPAILLVTENFASGWSARPLVDGPQKQYSILPANYCLRAIPLQSGHHEILMEYSPRSYQVGRWITLVAVLGYLVGLMIVVRKSQLPQTRSQGEEP